MSTHSLKILLIEAPNGPPSKLVQTLKDHAPESVIERADQLTDGILTLHAHLYDCLFFRFSGAYGPLLPILKLAVGLPHRPYIVGLAAHRSLEGPALSHGADEFLTEAEITPRSLTQLLTVCLRAGANPINTPGSPTFSPPIRARLYRKAKAHLNRCLAREHLHSASPSQLTPRLRALLNPSDQADLINGVSLNDVTEQAVLALSRLDNERRIIRLFRNLPTVATTRSELLSNLMALLTVGLKSPLLSPLVIRTRRVQSGASFTLGPITPPNTHAPLARVSHFAQLHGGSLSIETKHHQGATLTLYLPLFSENQRDKLLSP